MRMLRIAIAVVAAAVLAGCQTGGIPKFRAAAIEPASLEPGQTALITIDVQDSHSIVKRIEGIIENYPDRTFELKDDGIDPDVTANDGVWTMKVSVPFQAPPGEHFVKFIAYDENGRPIQVPDKEGFASELATTLRVVISYPAEQVQPPQNE